jgi:integrase
MKVVEKFKIILTNKNYSTRTIEIYVHYLEKFLKDLGKNPYHITQKEIEAYLLRFNYSGVSQQNQIIGSIKLFARYILNKKEVHLSKLERPKKEKKLPRIIDVQMLRNKILAIRNKKHKAILALGLGCAMRVSEVINLKIADIDGDRSVIHIRNAKGRKDRIVPVSDELLKILRDYYKAYRPKVYLFNGQFSDTYSAASCNKIMKKYIHPKAHFHQLRHSGATHIHETGTDIATISKFLGHNSVKTTMIYTHVSNEALKRIRPAI